MWGQRGLVFPWYVMLVLSLYAFIVLWQNSLKMQIRKEISVYSSKTIPP